MFPLRIAVATRCFHQPLKLSLPIARKIGAAGVQIDARNELRPSNLSETGKRQFLHRLDELGLAVASLSFPTRSTFYDLDRLDERIAGAKSAMQFAYQLKATVVVARIGRIPENVESLEFRTLTEVLNDLAIYGNHVGTMFSLTPCRDSVESLSALLAAISRGPIGIDFDPAALAMSGVPTGEAFRTLHDSVTHVRVRDAVRSVDGDGLEVPVGRGEVEWDELLALLDETNYHGWLTIDRTQGEDKQADAARAVQFLKQILIS